MRSQLITLAGNHPCVMCIVHFLFERSKEVNHRTKNMYLMHQTILAYILQNIFIHFTSPDFMFLNI